MYVGTMLPVREGEITPPPGEKCFNNGKNASKSTKLIVEPYICDNLSRIYRFFLIFNKTILKGTSFRNVLENRLKNNELIFFLHLWY